MTEDPQRSAADVSFQVPAYCQTRCYVLCTAQADKNLSVKMHALIYFFIKAAGKALQIIIHFEIKIGRDLKSGSSVMLEMFDVKMNLEE